MRKAAVPFALILVLLAGTFAFGAKPASAAESATENSWTTEAPMHEAREKLGVAAAKGKIYAIGGDTLSGFWTYSMGLSGTPTGGVVGDNEEYDPGTNTWTFKAPMLTPRTGFAIASVEDKIYCIGGATTHNIYTGPTVSSLNEVYDPVTNTWETKKPMPTATWLTPANAVNGKIYVIDWDGKVYAYDVAMDSWSIKLTAPKPSAAGFDGHVSAVVDGKIHIIGGLSTGGDSNLHQVYDPDTDNWTSASFPPNSIGNAVGQGAATATTGELALKRIYAYGQQGNLRQGEPQGTNRIYDPQNDGWEFGANLPTDRIYFGTAVLNDAIYVIGGGIATNWFVGTFGPSAVNEKYTPLGYGIPDPSYDVTPPQIAILSPENRTYYKTDLSLNFSINESVSWASYKLDNETETEISGNTTISGLSFGSHVLALYASDHAGNQASQTIHFTIEEPEPFPTAPVVAAVSAVSIAAVVAGLILFIRRRRRKEAQQK